MTMEVSMRSHGMDRRTFLKRGVGLGVGALAGSSWPQAILAASKARLTILSSISLDSLHPYAYSSAPQYGAWQHMIEPLVDIDYAKRQYYGVLAESWVFQGNKWVLRLRKVFRFHAGGRFT